MAKTRHTAFDAFATRQLPPEPAAWHTRRALGESLREGLQMSPYEGALLAWLLRLKGAERVVEVGSFVGLSALYIAQALPPTGRVISIERNTDYAKLARETMQAVGETRVEIVEADALEQLQAMPAHSMCAAFLDGEKRTYPEMLEEAARVVKKGGLIVADNTLLFGAMLGEEPTARVSDAQKQAMERFFAILADTARFDSMTLPTLEGLSVAVVK